MRPAGCAERHLQHLVEIAVVDIPAPIDAHQIAAHHVLEVLAMISVLEQRHVVAELVLGNQHAAKTLDRHVRDREQTVELDAVLVEKMLAIIRLQLHLGRRQRGAARVVDQIELQAAVLLAIPQPVELAQGLDAALEDMLAALVIDVWFRW